MNKGITYNIKNSTIIFYNIIYKFDYEQIDLILNSGINFKLYNNIYISYNNTHSKNITILEFLFNNKQWYIKEVYLNNNGLTILERNDKN